MRARKIVDAILTALVLLTINALNDWLIMLLVGLYGLWQFSDGLYRGKRRSQEIWK